MSIPDEAAIDCMRLLAGEDVALGESGVAGLAGFLLATADSSAREKLLLDADNRVLMFGTEGITDAAVSAGLLRSRSN